MKRPTKILAANFSLSIMRAAFILEFERGRSVFRYFTLIFLKSLLEKEQAHSIKGQYSKDNKKTKQNRIAWDVFVTLHFLLADLAISLYRVRVNKYRVNKYIIKAYLYSFLWFLKRQNTTVSENMNNRAHFLQWKHIFVTNLEYPLQNVTSVKKQQQTNKKKQAM